MKLRLKRLLSTVLCVIIFATGTESIYAEEAETDSPPDFTARKATIMTQDDEIQLYKQADDQSEVIATLNYGVWLNSFQTVGAYYQVWLPAEQTMAYVRINKSSVINFSDDTLLKNMHSAADGDTMSAIAASYGTSLQGLLAINHANPDSKLINGQIIYIPYGKPDSGPNAANDKIPKSFALGAKSVKSYKPLDINRHWAAVAMDDLLNADILTGIVRNGNVYLHPDEPVTRAEFATILLRALGTVERPAQPFNGFEDVQPEKWYYDTIKKAVEQGIVQGTENGLFLPDKPVTREEIAAMLVRAFEQTIPFPQEATTSFLDVKDNWAASSIAKASAAGIIKGATTTSFRPASNATRAESATMVYRALQMETADPLTEHQVIYRFIVDQRDLWFTVRYGDYNTHAPMTYNYLKSYIKGSMTGYLRQDLLYQTAKFEKLQSSNGMRMLLHTAEYQLDRDVSVIHRSRQFASIRISNVNYDFDLTGEIQGLSRYRDQIVTMDGLLLLKKTAPGTWKLYNFIPSKPTTPHLIQNMVTRATEVLNQLRQPD